jgi:hypothetical protein
MTENIWLKLGLPMLLVLVAGLVYSPTLFSEFTNYDDPTYITINLPIQSGLSYKGFIWSLTDLHTNNWHPLTWLSHMLDVQLFGLNPAGHHLTNLLLHIANTLLLGLLLHRITRSFWPSWVVAALFALHPLHVESVAWVAERKDVLCAFFSLLTIWFYTKVVQRPTLARWLTVLSTYILALLSKPMAVTLPFVLLLIDFWPLGRWQRFPHISDNQQIPCSSLWKLVLEKLPLFVFSAMAIFITIYAQKAALSSKPFSSRLSNSVESYGSYLLKTFWPTKMAACYPFPQSFNLWYVYGLLFLLLILTTTCLAFAKKHPVYLMGWLWFLGSLVPVIGIVHVGDIGMADRYTYLPSIGLYIIIIWGGAAIARQLKIPSRGTAVLTVALLLALGGLTLLQVGFWKNSETLFRHTLSVTENNYQAHYNLGLALMSKGDLEGAEQHCMKSLQIRPTYDNPYVCMGTILGMKGRPRESIEYSIKAVTLNPQNSDAYLNLGNAYVLVGEKDKAQAILNTLEQLNPIEAELLRQFLSNS